MIRKKRCALRVPLKLLKRGGSFVLRVFVRDYIIFNLELVILQRV